jgi:6-phosphogluconolactonase
MSSSPATAADVPFYIGTYTKAEGSKGIYLQRLNLETGAMTPPELAAEVQNPTFLAFHPNGTQLYAAVENGNGAVAGFSLNAEGKLEKLNEQPSKGGGACHIAIDPNGRYALVANYGGGSVAALPIGKDGQLVPATGFAQHTGSSANPQRQKEPHAHSIYSDRQGQFIYACDLGTDQVLIYRLDQGQGTLTPHEPAFAKLAPGSGPRHLAFHERGFAYVINELLNTVTAFKHDAAAGTLKEIQTIPTLPDGFTGQSSTAEIFIHPNGKFVYGSNRGHESIVVYAIGDDGRLTLVDHTPTQGKHPRNFAIDPSGKFLLAANQNTDDIVSFRIDQATGKLTPTGHTTKLSAPVCIVFPPQK